MAHQFCILVRSCLGKKKEKGFMKSSTSKVDVLPGTLLLFVWKDQDNPKSHQYELECIDQDNIGVLCNEEDFQNISEDEYQLLITVPTCQDRFTIFQNKEWLNEGLSLKVNDYVEVYDKPSALDLNGVLRYKGPVQGVPGIHFGVELSYNLGQGSSDGVFRNQRYFTCEPESAVFVGLHRIRKSKEPLNSNAASHKNNYDRYGLCVGDRVVWVSDAGPEHGSVKWIGLLPDSRSKDDVTVGVEFDNAVGSGTGKYKDKRLFTARQGHASLVPIMGLMKEAEFLGNSKPTDTVKPGEAVTYDTVAIAEALGKSKAEVIEEQFRILEAAQHHKGTNASGGASGGVSGGSVTAPQATHASQPQKTPQLNPQEAGYQSQVVAEVHHPPPAPHRSFSQSKNVNPLYEYNRSKNDYLPDDIGPVVTQETSSSPVATGGGSQPNSSRYKNLPSTTPDPELDVGSLVEVMSSRPLYGLIKWIGNLPDQKEPKKLIAGLEMEEEITAGTDGTFGGHRMFSCPSRKGLFVPLYKCRKDKRFCDQGLARSASMDRSINFGSTETPDLCGTISPPDSLDDITIICGKGKGIQGHHNSCYMDATLLAMFYFTTVFDSILHRPKTAVDLTEYAEVQQVLKEGIVNPLRRHHYVRADKMMKLRRLLDKVGKIPGMMSEEKDPEEFLNLLLSEITKADPFLRICSETNQDVQLTYFYQLIMEKDERLVLPTTQQLFELSFLQMGIKLKEVPSCLIIQMPRFGKDYKMYRRILPSLELDITDVLENVPRECIICGDLAAFECKECYQVHGAGLNTIAFCEGCKKTSHQHKARINHQCRQINVPARFKDTFNLRKAMAGQPVPIPREKMELFAVICIQTSHYVSFVKTGRGNRAKWIFFDSMADRMGEQSGYNIPEVKICDEIPLWLSEEFNSNILKSQGDKELPEHMRRLISDAYICMYQSPNVMMFK